MTALLQTSKILTILVIIAFMSVALLSFAVMLHGGEGEMGSGCLFSTGEASLCSQNALALVVHHISAYRAFINVPTGSGLLTMLFTLLAIALAIFIISRALALLSQPKLVLAHRVSNFPPGNSFQRKVIRWLSLLENSPAF